jgi:hypothetical protein
LHEPAGCLAHEPLQLVTAAAHGLVVEPGPGDLLDVGQFCAPVVELLDAGVAGE